MSNAPINARALLADSAVIDHSPLYVRWLCERVIELEDAYKAGYAAGYAHARQEQPPEHGDYEWRSQIVCSD
jgi:hypothetical protein